jgi:hypothetical protein
LTEASQYPIDAVRAGIGTMPGGALSGETGQAGSPGMSSVDQASYPPGSGAETAVQPSSATDLTPSVDVSVTNPSIMSLATLRNEDRRPGEQERQQVEKPAGSESDSASVLQQLPAAIQRIQDQADTVEQAMNRALNQVIRTQEMLTNRLARLDQKSRQSLQASEQVGQYLDQTGPSALNFGGS